jgi:glutamate-1-semialdehyde aminotransferase
VKQPTEAARPRTLTKSEELWQRAQRVIPGGTQTLSKSPAQFVDGVSPKFLARGKGSHVWDVDGNEYIDYPLALGPIVLGYDYAPVSKAAIDQIREGTVFTLAHPKEVELAELLVDIIPCAEKVRFAKNGADATNAAIRAARAVTGREHVISTGYHGYHDWFITSTERNAGVPQFNHDLIHPIYFGDLDALESAFDEHDGEIAALIMDVSGGVPPEGYLDAVVELVHRRGALLVFDEIVSGFRYAIGGAQELYGVVPDLACFGKGMANGFPLAAVVGSAEAMEAFDRVFFSTTYGGETVSIAASLATLDVMTSEPVIEHMWRVGADLWRGIEELAADVSFGASLSGIAPRAGLAFTIDGERSFPLRGLFLQETHKRGVLFGAPIFFSYSHDDADIRATLAAVEAAFEVMEKAYAGGDIEQYLEGVPPGQVFKASHL